MKKIIFFSLIVIMSFFIKNDVSAYNACTNITPTVPCTIEGIDMDGMIGITGNFLIFYEYSTSSFPEAGTTTMSIINSATHAYLWGNGLITSYGQFNSTLETFFWTNEPTCFDGIQNQDETAIDFGGICGEDANLIQGSTFVIKFLNADGQQIQNGTNIQSLFSSTGFQIQGKNPYGVFDLITITILEDDSIISSKTYDVSPNSSTIINYVDTTLGELANSSTDPFTYDSGKKYGFNVVVSSELISEVFNLSGFVFYNTEGICGLDIICYIKDGAEWLFIPSQQSIENFGELTLSNSFPFSYIYDMDNLYEDAFDQAPQNINVAIAFGSFGDITLMSTEKLDAIPFQSTVRTVLGAILIFGTVMYIYRKIINIHQDKKVA